MSQSNRAFRIVAAVTASRLLFAAGIGALAMTVYEGWVEQASWMVICTLVLLGLAEISDALDGHMARKYGVVSDFGKMFDPYCDSVSRLIIYWSLAITGCVWVIVPLVMAGRDVTVSYSRIIMTRRGIDVSARLTGKLKAIVQGVCAPLLFATFWMPDKLTPWVIAGGSVAVILITLWSMVDYVRAALSAAPSDAAPESH